MELELELELELEMELELELELEVDLDKWGATPVFRRFLCAEEDDDILLEGVCARLRVVLVLIIFN